MEKYGVMAAVKDSLLFFVGPRETAGRLKDSSPVPYRTSIGALLFFIAITVLLQLLGGRRLPVPAGASTLAALLARGAGMAVAGLIMLAISFLGAAVLHLIAKWGGAAENSYRRNYQLQALLGCLIPMHLGVNMALAGLSPARYLARALLTLWNLALSVEGLSQLHRMTRGRVAVGYLKFLAAVIAAIAAFVVLAGVLKGVGSR